MKTRRFLAILLTLLMVLSLFPATALANTDAVAPEVHSAGTIPAGWGPPSPPPLQKTISHWWPFLNIDIDFSLWNIIGGNFPISVTLECNMFLALTQLHAMALVTPVGSAGMTMNLTHDIVMPAMAPPAAVPAGATLYIRSSQPGVQRTITNLAFTEHFIIGPGATLVLEDVILCGGSATLPSLFTAHHGGVRVEGRCLLLLQPVGGHLIMHRGSAIRNSNAVGNPIFRSRGGGVYLNCGMNTLFMPRSGGQLTMLPGSRIHDNVAARGGGVYASINSVVRMAEGSRIDNNEARSVGNIVNAYNTGTGGGIHLSANAVLDMRGGSIDNNTAVYGGGVRLRGSNIHNRAELHMSGGEIHSNRARGSHSILTHPALGGGIRACANSDITMTGGRIHNNTSANGGGGVSLGYHSLTTMSLVPFANSGATLTMRGGYIENNTAVTGGGVRLSAGALLSVCNTRSPRFTMLGGTIRDNEAAEGGGVWLQRSTRLEMDRTRTGFFQTPTGPTPVIEGNEATRRGGGLFVSSCAHAYLRQGIFRNNEARVDGGAVFTQKFFYFTPILVYPMYCDVRVVNAGVEFTGNYAGRGAYRPPVANLRGGLFPIPFYRYFTNNSTSVSPVPHNTGSGLFQQADPRNWRLALNNWDVNFIGVPWDQDPTDPQPDMAIAYFLRNDHHDYPYSLHDQDVVTPIPGRLLEPIEEPVWFPRYEGQVRHVFAGWSLTDGQNGENQVAVDFGTEGLLVTSEMLETRLVDWLDEPDFSYDYINLYAIWEEMPRFRMSFIGNGGTPAYTRVYVYADTTYAEAIAMWQAQVELEHPEWNNWIFQGWAIEEFGRFNLIQGLLLDDVVYVRGNFALFAQWDAEPEPVQALFIGNGGSPGEVLVVTHETPLSYGRLIDMWEYQTGLTEPTKVGYEFIGWSRSSVDGYPIVYRGSTVSHNILLFAQWRALIPPMAVTFEGNGGTFVSGTHERVTVFADEIGTYGAAVGLLRLETGGYRSAYDGTIIGGYTMPFRPGYIFQGWFYAPSGGDPVNLASVINNNERTHTLYAQWEPVPVTAYEVIFLGNGGTPVLKTIIMDQDPSTYAAAIAQWQYWAGKYVPTREGYTFLGWARVTGTEYQMIAPESNITERQNILAAQWQPVEAPIVVTFRGNGGAPDGEVVELFVPTTYGEAIAAWQDQTVLPEPTRAGYTFRGWFHNPAGGVPVAAGSALTASTTLYAQWTALPDPIVVTFLGNGGEPTIQSIAINAASTTYGAAIAAWQYQVGLTAPIRPGYNFLGWARTIATGGYEMVALGSTLTENTILIAQWEAIPAAPEPIRMSFVGNGGTPAYRVIEIEETTTYAQAIGIWQAETDRTVPIRSGYRFLHWSLYEDGTGGPVSGNVRVTGAQRFVLFAIWEAEAVDLPIVPLQVTFIGNGGQPAHEIVEFTTPTTTYGAAITAWQAQTSQTIPTQEGYTFRGWSRSSLRGGEFVTNTSSISANILLFAQWEREVDDEMLTVTFVGNGGYPAFEQVTFNLTETPNPTYAQAIAAWRAQTRLTDPTRHGHEFLHWSLLSGGNAVTGTLPIDPAHAVLYAIWEEIPDVIEPEPILLSFVGNGGAPVYEAVTIQNTTTFNQAIALWRTQTGEQAPTKEGFTFAGWSLTPTGAPVTGAANVVTTIGTGQFALFAQWTLIPGVEPDPVIEVTFLGHGGEPAFEVVTINAASTTYGAAIDGWETQTDLTEPTKAGYIFLGWSRISTPSGQIVTPVSTINSNILLFAQWQSNSVQVPVLFLRNYEGAADDGLFYESTVTLGANLTAPTAGAPTREDFLFRGWYLEPTNETAKGFDTPVTEALLCDDEGHLRLYARWEENPEPQFHAWFMQGNAQGLFNPHGNITRGDVAAILVRTFAENYNLAAPPAMPFTDVNATEHWEAAYIAWAFHLDFVRGRVDDAGNPIFSPREPVSREELAAMVARAAELDLSGTGTPHFPDADQITPWAVRYVYAVTNESWIRGDGYGNLRPTDPIQRSEAAAVIARALGRDGVTNTASLVDVREDLRIFPDVLPGTWHYYLIIEVSHSHYFLTESVVIEGVARDMERWTEITWPN
ncbi:MAG: InlB B-repeat-containing protein [Oscillospiraceae bacterium]|nr:InlB B-repeat-containing protein [Oscillospiraceae bacterium]